MDMPIENENNPNAFRELETPVEVPVTIKKNVDFTLNTARQTGTVADLFLGQMASTFIGLLDITTTQQDDANNQKS